MLFGSCDLRTWALGLALPRLCVVARALPSSVSLSLDATKPLLDVMPCSSAHTCASPLWAFLVDLARVIILISVAWFQHSYRRVDGARTLVRVGVVAMSLLRVLMVYDNMQWLSALSVLITVIWLGAATRWATVTFTCAWRAANVMIKVPSHQRRWIRSIAWLSLTALTASYVTFSVLQVQADEDTSCERYYKARIIIVLAATIVAALFATLCHFILQQMLAQLPVGPRGLKPRALRKMRAMHILSIFLVTLSIVSAARSLPRGAAACNTEELLFEEAILTLWSATFLYHTDSMRDFNDKKFVDIVTVMFSTRFMMLSSRKTTSDDSDDDVVGVKKAGGRSTPAVSTRDKMSVVTAVHTDMTPTATLSRDISSQPLTLSLDSDDRSHDKDSLSNKGSGDNDDEVVVKMAEVKTSAEELPVAVSSPSAPASTENENASELEGKKDTVPDIEGKSTDGANDAQSSSSKPVHFSASEPALESTSSSPETSSATKKAAAAMSSSSPTIAITVKPTSTSTSVASTDRFHQARSAKQVPFSRRKRDSGSRSRSRSRSRRGSRRLRFMKSLRNLRQNGVFKSSDIFEPADDAAADEIEMDQKDALSMLLQAF